MKISRFLPLLGIIIFVVIISKIDFLSALESLLSANLILVLIVILLHIPVLLIKAGKWKVLIKSYDIGISWNKALSSWLIGFFIGIITPGRLGDFTRAYYIKDKISFGRGTTTVIVDRIIDLFVLFSLAIFGIIFLFYTRTLDLTYLSLATIFIILFILFISAIFLFIREGLTKKLFKPFFNRFVPKRYKSKINFTFNEFYRGLYILRDKKRSVLISLTISYIGFLIVIFQYYILALALGINELYFSFIFSIIPIIILLDTLPISFSGIGTRDAALIIFLGLVGASPETAVSFSLLVLFSSYFIVGIVGLIFWIRNPIKIDL